MEYVLLDDELHDSICAPARKYIKETLPEERDESVFKVARLTADNKILKRRIERLEFKINRLMEGNQGGGDVNENAIKK